jgi:hypothetical protein
MTRITPLVGRAVLKTALAVALICSGLTFAGAPEAYGESGSPWWNAEASVAPSVLPVEGTGKVVIAATNLGDGEADGSIAPITVSDKLPAGVEAIGINSTTGEFGFGARGECQLVTVSCTVRRSILPYEQVAVEVEVRVRTGVQSGALNEIVAEGGGASRYISRRPFAIGEGNTPFGVQAFEMVPENVGGTVDTQAGSHPFQLTTTLDLNESVEAGEAVDPELVKNLHFDLPAGLIGNSNAVPQCTSLEFSTETNSGSACPLDTVIGVANTTIGGTFFGRPVTAAYPLFNLAPNPGEPARFGYEILHTPIILDTSIRTGGDYGVVVSVPEISQTADLLASQVTFWGAPYDPRHNAERGTPCLTDGFFGAGAPCEALNEPRYQPLLTMPTSCGAQWAPAVSAYSWPKPNLQTTGEYSLHEQSGQALGLTGCGRLTFEPSISVTPDGQAGSTPTGLTVGIHVPQTAGLNPHGDAQATVKNTTVVLPAGVGLNPAGADGLSSCGEGEVDLNSPEEVSCPESSKVGTVEIKTPLLANPMVGAAYLADQNANPFGSLVALYIVARDPVSGVLVKLAGEVKPDPVTGQLVSTFKETPQLPFEDLYLHFFGGSRAPLGTPALCGGYTTTASIEPWSGTEPINSSSEFKVTSGPNGSPCSAPLPFKPTLTGGTTSIQAGGFSPFTMTMSREDGEQNLQSIQLKMPPGLLGTLSTVKLCGEPQADEGTCGSESLVGETTVSVGLGGNPYAVTGGRVYITGPHDGAPYGLSIVNPAKAGPFNLGDVIVRAKIEVDPSTAALTITTDPSGPYAIPHILEGIPLQIKHVNVTISRPNFTFNPTNCSPLAITGSLGSSEGSSSALSVPFQVTNCAVLAFKPKLTASTTGKPSRVDGASLTVKLGYPAGPYDANIAKVKVELPKQLPSRLPTLQKACAAATFEANPANCPSASIIGHATATTPVLPVPLTGPAYFVSHGGEAFPSLIVVLQGYGTTVDLVGSTFISKSVTSSTFKTIPDVPVGTFELTLPQGQYSALTANGNLCKSKPVMPTEFVGQNGVVLHQSTKIAVTGCPTAKKIKAKKTTHKKKGKGRGKGARGEGKRAKQKG